MITLQVKIASTDLAWEMDAGGNRGGMWLTYNSITYPEPPTAYGSLR